jgi:dihydrodipicolinate synthase/N-acetylneuraminate lyase
MTFAGIRPVLHTPFADAPGAPVAHAELAALVRDMAGHGVDGVVALGLASEASALTEDERDAVVQTAVAAAGRLPVTVGIAGSTSVAVRRSARAAALGAGSLMVVPPPGAGRGALLDHYAAVAGAGLPVLVQDAPQVTGVMLDADALLALGAAVPAARAVKVEGPAAGPKVSALVARGVAVVAGWGGLHYPEALRRGACGLMPGCDLAPAFVALHAAWRDGRPDEADDRYEALLPYLAYQTQSLELLILSAKRELVRRGLFSAGTLRDPTKTLDRVQDVWLERCADRLAARGVPGWASVSAPGARTGRSPPGP